ncbi:MAG: hypothetical protein FWD76_03190 [Firmicutes bacterium]|nr:hypothetical protein [Bacillota bacterium]
MINENKTNEQGIARIPQTQEQVDSARARLVAERAEISEFYDKMNERFNKLNEFLDGEIIATLPIGRQRDLAEQVGIMGCCKRTLFQYLKVLCKRLEKWEQDK